MTVYRALAPAKVNLGLFLGPMRTEDGRHELVTVMQSISLADELTLELAPPGAAQDELVCPGVPGPPGENLAGAALRAFRARTGWNARPLRLSIHKRIPVAAGLGGGSADAAAALRLARRASGLGDEELLRELGIDLGADVPAQVSPGRWLATGAGEHLQKLPGSLPPGPDISLGLLVLPLAAELSTAAVYAEADRLGLARTPQALESQRQALLAAWTAAAGELNEPIPAARELLHNDLQRAAVSLCPEIAGALAEAREAGSDLALVSGSGPTVIGLFTLDDPRRGCHRATSGGCGGAGEQRAAGAAPAGLQGRLPASLQDRVPAALCATPVDAAFARVATVAERRQPAREA
jgi:4-diphosphocytidyl-2-C-methyl-D-erythritol kinase